MPFDRREFRNALGLFPTGVAVVAALCEGVPVGMTVNSFTSVSLDPPLILWCLDRKSDRFARFTGAPAYTINILGTEHGEISSRLAKQGQHRLDDVPLLEIALGPPALANALAVFACRHHAMHDGGDHAILVGRVEHFVQPGEGAPLVFFRGKYGALA